METRRQIQTARICDMASAIRAAGWPHIRTTQAIRIAVKFIEVIGHIEQLEREMYFPLET